VQTTQKSIKELCRELRKAATTAENILWKELRNRNFVGLKFNRQFPIIYNNYGNRKLFFIADFYCHEENLIIEVDGKIHDLQKEYDANRDSILQELKIRVLRFRNDELEDTNTVLNKIKEFLTHPRK
jgi:very-short-patch-repair endonuclease